MHKVLPLVAVVAVAKALPAVSETRATTGVQLVGVNIAGFDFGCSM